MWLSHFAWGMAISLTQVWVSPEDSASPQAKHYTLPLWPGSWAAHRDAPARLGAARELHPETPSLRLGPWSFFSPFSVMGDSESILLIHFLSQWPKVLRPWLFRFFLNTFSSLSPPWPSCGVGVFAPVLFCHQLWHWEGVMQGRKLIPLLYIPDLVSQGYRTHYGSTEKGQVGHIFTVFSLFLDPIPIGMCCCQLLLCT